LPLRAQGGKLNTGTGSRENIQENMRESLDLLEQHASHDLR